MGLLVDQINQIAREVGLNVDPFEYTNGRLFAETPFVTMVSAGIKVECGPTPAWYATRELACDAYAESVRQYLEAEKTKGGTTLCWRCKPFVEYRKFLSSEFEMHEFATVYSRLCVDRRTDHG